MKRSPLFGGEISLPKVHRCLNIALTLSPSPGLWELTPVDADESTADNHWRLALLGGAGLLLLSHRPARAPIYARLPNTHDSAAAIRLWMTRYSEVGPNGALERESPGPPMTRERWALLRVARYTANRPPRE